MAAIQTILSSLLFTSRLASAFPLSNLRSSPPKLRLKMDVSAGDGAVAKGSVTGSHAANTANTNSESDPLIQYVVLRRDLIDTWPLGSIVSQGCHASVAAIAASKDDPHTVLYCNLSNLDVMRKVTVEVKDEAQILSLSEKLNSSCIAHKLWIEQPENIPTCIATKPYPKSIVSSHFKRLKLCK